MIFKSGGQKRGFNSFSQVLCNPFGELAMRGSRKFFQRGSTFFFLVNEWIKIQLKSSHPWPASERPFEWRLADIPMMAQH